MSPPDQPAAPKARPSPSPSPSEPELVPAGDRDRHINLGFEAYRPVRPIVGKARSENLLWHSLLHAGALAAWGEALHAVQRQAGVDRSVWGVFLDLERHLAAPPGSSSSSSGAAALSWELRVLNTEARSPLGVIDTLRETLAPWIELAPGLEQAPPYAVLGLRFDAQTMAAGKIETVELHERVPGTPRLEVWETGVRAGEAVRELVSRDLVLEPKRNIDEVLPAIKASEFVDFEADKRLLGRVMIPELFACRRLHIRKQAGWDALCFSGVNIEQLLFAYKRFEYPEAMLAFLVEHQDRLEHVLYDVVVGYRQREGRLVYPRTGYYGSF